MRGRGLGLRQMRIRGMVALGSMVLLLAGAFGGGVDHCGTPVNAPDADGCCQTSGTHGPEEQAPCHQGHLGSCCAPHAGLVMTVDPVVVAPARGVVAAHPTGGIAVDPAVADLRPPIAS